MHIHTQHSFVAPDCGTASVSTTPATESPEKLLTFSAAAAAVGVRTWHIRRAAKRGAIPTYRPFNSRQFVLLSEVVAHIQASRRGGEA